MIKNRSTVWNKANNSSADQDKFIQLPKIANASLPTAVADGSSGENEGGIAYDTTNNKVYFSNGSSWAAIDTSGATAYDDIGDPDANTTVAFAGYTNTWTSTLDNGTVFTISNTDADLAADTSLIDLKFTDDGDSSGLFLRAYDNSGSDLKFSIGADGATTIAGNAKGTDALTLTAGDITLTSGHLNMSDGDFTIDAGDIKVSADNQKVTFGASDATDSYIHFDGSNLVFYDSTYGAERTLTQIAGATTAYDDVSDPDANSTIAFTSYTNDWTFTGTGDFFGITANSVTTGDVLSVTANGLTSGSMVYLESSAAGMAGEYIRCYDGAADDFVVGANGAVTIAGSAAGTDALTLTAGDVTLSSGDLTVTTGTITVADTADSANKISRNNATGTNPVFEVEQSHATGGVALLVDQDATGDVNAQEITNAGTGFSLTSTGGAAGSEGFEFISATGGTGNGLLLDGTTNTWVGAASTGFAQIQSDGTLADTSATLLRLAFSGTSASGGQGTALRIEDTSTSGGGTEYAMYISSTNSEALYVDSGRVLLDEGVTITDSGTLVVGEGGEWSLSNDGSAADLTITGNYTIGDGGSSNYTSFAANTGAVSFAGTARPTKSLWLSPNDFTDQAGSPALTANGTGAGKGWAFDADSDESISTTFFVPDNWASGTDVSVYLYWATSDTNTNDVIFDVITVPLAEDEDSQGAGNTDSVTDTAVSATAWDLNKTGAITVTASTEWAAGDMVILKINRDADNGSDTIAADVVLLGVQIDYTADSV